MNLKQKLNRAWEKLKANRRHCLPALVGVAAVSVFQFAAARWSPGWGSYFAALPALAIIIVTALARLDDIGLDKKTPNWQARRFGLILSGVGAVYLLAGPFSEEAVFPSWIAAMFAWGVALTWVTTPQLPPWWKYITGEYKQKDVNKLSD